ncbi:helix-turn-helix domain-containing protein [Lacticaseibacillus saniviri]|uniref:helix-turn-helix domain-containing protein n=1 Tax=Lacticaseibacillus saniviri TaxID=931533 RepID=UPI0006D20220|nr:helix-turn-helix domain-containing protein [Lacticaseibacillus saniviri]
MTKYSNEFKSRAVKRYLNGGISLADVCQEFDIPSHRTLQEWVSHAQSHGLESLRVKHSRTNYPQEFKLAVVHYLHTHQTSRAQTAAHFGISSSQVNAWDRIVREQGVVGLRPKPKGRQPSDMAKHKTNKPIKPIKRLEPTQEEKYQQEILELKQKLHKAELDRDILKAYATLTKKPGKTSQHK